METQIARQTLHKLIDQIEDGDVLGLYVKLLERETSRMPIGGFFKTTDNDLTARAKASLKSVEDGNTRNIEDFKKDVEAWKKSRAI